MDSDDSDEEMESDWISDDDDANRRDESKFSLEIADDNFTLSSLSSNYIVPLQQLQKREVFQKYIAPDVFTDDDNNDDEDMEDVVTLNFLSNTSIISGKVTIRESENDFYQLEDIQDEENLIDWMSKKHRNIYNLHQRAKTLAEQASDMSDDVIINVYMNYYNPEVAAINGFFCHFNSINTKAQSLLIAVSKSDKNEAKFAKSVRQAGKNMRGRANAMLNFAVNNVTNNNQDSSISRHNIIFSLLFKETLKIASDIQLDLLPVIKQTLSNYYTSDYKERVMPFDEELLFRGVIPKTITETATVNESTLNNSNYNFDENAEFDCCAEEGNIVLGLIWSLQDHSTKLSILKNCKSNNLTGLKKILSDSGKYLVLKKVQGNKAKKAILHKVVIEETSHLIAYKIKQMEFDDNNVQINFYSKPWDDKDFIDPMKCSLPISFQSDVSILMTSSSKDEIITEEKEIEKGGEILALIKKQLLPFLKENFFRYSLNVIYLFYFIILLFIFLELNYDLHYILCIVKQAY